MELKDYVEKIKFQLTGGILESELKDKDYEKIINFCVREINNYYNVAELIEVKGGSCIDLTPYPQINNVIGVHRPSAVASSITTGNLTTMSDPYYVSYQVVNSPYGFSNDWTYNISTNLTKQRLMNQFSTDLDFRVDEKNKKLYINFSQGVPGTIVIEFIPKLNDASEVLTQHWQDILYRLSLADAKVALGRIRTRYRQTNALYEDDGDTILAEGLTEGDAIRTRLKEQADLVLPLD